MKSNIDLGQIYKVHTDSYTVKAENRLIKCNARGVLKIKSDGLSVGDYVRVEKNTILEILPRKNRFIRPNVSNVDLVVIVISPEPKPDFYLIDKLVLNASKENVDVVFVINKTDLSDCLFDVVKEEYGNLNFTILKVSAIDVSGIEQLKTLLNGKLSVLAGQSAVGKTSIINSMFGLSQKTGDLSEKILRGRHTTTRSEIFEQNNIKIIDSPGFAVIDANVDLDELPTCYSDYEEVSINCKFRGCSHVSEPDCAVKQMVENGNFSKNRYERYVEIYNEIAKRRKIYEKN